MSGTGSGTPSSVQSLVAVANEVTLKGQLVSPRWGMSGAQFRHKLYLFGGYLWCNGIEGFFQDMYELDLLSGTMRRVPVESPTVPSARFGHSLVADPQTGNIILFGGRNSSESFSDLWAFDIHKNTWSQLSGMDSGPRRKKKSGSQVMDNEFKATDGAASCGLLPAARSWQTMNIFRGCAYVYGGWDHNNKVFNDLWCFEFSTNSWSKIENAADATATAMPFPAHGRSCHQSAIWGDSMYILGGLRDGDTAVSDMWKFNLETRVWSPVEVHGSKPLGRTSAASVVIDNQWTIHGGLHEFPRAGLIALDEVLQFDFLTSTWTSRNVLTPDSLRTAARRYGHVVVGVPNSSGILLVGGAEKHASASSALACRIDLLPGQTQVTDLQAEMIGTKQLATMNRERLTDLVEIIQNYDGQIRQLKLEIAALTDRMQAMQGQMNSVHENHTSLATQLANLQTTVGAVEQVIPMMRSVGQAIASFGNAAAASFTAPGSSSNLGRSASTASAGAPTGGLMSAHDLRLPRID